MNVFGTEPIDDSVPPKKPTVVCGVVAEGVVGVLPPHPAASDPSTKTKIAERFIKTSLPQGGCRRKHPARHFNPGMGGPAPPGVLS
jgi:hypothetical protein